MKLVLLGTIIGAVLIASGLLMLYVDVCRRIKDLESDLNDISKKHSRTKQRVRVLEQRDQEKSNRVVITHSWDEASGIRYPSEEV